MVKHGYNENWRESDNVYEEMPDDDKRLLSKLMLHNLHSFLYHQSPLTEGTHINPNRYNDFKMGTYNIFSTRDRPKSLYIPSLQC